MHYIRRFFGLTTLALSATAATADVGPAIAYAKDGSRPEIYLVNPDGTGVRLLYRGANRTKIFSVDMRPGGGEVSFEEVACCSAGPAYLKTVSYAATGTTGTVTRSIQSCRINSLDYHSSDGSLMVVDNCARKLQRLASGSATPTDMGVPVTVFTGRWLSSGDSFVYGASGGLYRASLSDPASPTRLLTMQIMGDFDAGKQSEQLLHSADKSIDRIVLPSQFDKGIGQGSSPSFAPSDAEFIYLTPPQRGQSYIKIRRVDGSGSDTRIGAAGAYTSVDWRN